MIHVFVVCVCVNVRISVCVSVWRAGLTTVTFFFFSEAHIGKSFVLKRSLLDFFSLLPPLEPEFVTESSVSDIPPTVAHGDVTNEEL